MTLKSFTPPPLPPNIDYDPLIRDIGKARDALGELRGLLTHVKNPSLLTAPLLTKEAVTSSAIEGTQATLEEVYRYEAEEKTAQVSEREKDIREILNYRVAMRHAVRDLSSRPIAENYIRRLHATLLNSVRGANKDRGNLRRIPVHIGIPGRPASEARFIPPPPQIIPQLLSNWERYIHGGQERDPVVEIGIAHYQFEAIHPFVDGNGRIGRLLIPLQLHQKNLLPYPVLYISQFFEQHRRDYYNLLNAVSTEGRWIDWLQFFLNGVSQQAMETRKTINQMIKLHEALRERVGDMQSRYAVDVLDLLFTSPVVTMNTLHEQVKAKSQQTFYNLIKKFVDYRILYPVENRKKNRLFVFRALLRIVDQA